jgi:alpha-tubulin suppressor-like RCC1 family protein
MGDVDIGGRVTAFSAGQEHTCAILDGGVVRCWGHGRFGKLGYGDKKNVGEFEPPRAAGDVNVGGRVVAVEAGGFHTCAILDTDAVRCWGHGADGQLGYGNKRDVGVTDVPAAAGDVPLY